MPDLEAALTRRRFTETLRKDLWWVQPLVTFIGLGSFVVYATWAAFQGNHYEWGPYLSPFYSPLLFGDSAHSWFGARPGWMPIWVTAAMLILWAPGGFRVTCYYYRGAYYKSFWADPPACAVGEPRKHYRGEKSFPLILQNIHRFFLYLALIFIVILAYDVWRALWFVNPQTGKTEFGIGLGTLVLLTNVILLAGYTFGCHSLRHLIGGNEDEVSKKPLCYFAYQNATKFNRRHMLWAWMSLIMVMFSDVYVRMLSMGIWTDWRIL
jgi:hypothetical protein